MLDLDVKQKNIIITILNNHIPTHTVWAFGSRVNGTARKQSDIDLVIIDDTTITDSTLRDLRAEFDNSSLDIKVDIVLWHRLNDIFHKNIEQNYEMIQLKQEHL